MSIREFAPVGKEIKATHQLALDYDVHKELIFSITNAANQIEASPFAVPSYREVELGRIALIDDRGAKDPQGKLGVHFSENGVGSSNAIINIQRGDSFTRFRLSPGANDWESIAREGELPYQVVSNEDLVTLLDRIIYKKDAMKPLLDATHYPSMEIPRLLASQFSHNAPSRRNVTSYDALSSRISHVVPPVEFADIAIPSYDLTSAARLSTVYSNDYSQYVASVQSPIEIGKRTIYKKYSYEFKTRNHTNRLPAAVGRITLESIDGYSPQELGRFAERDQESLTPASEIIGHAVTELMLKHSLPDSRVA